MPSGPAPQDCGVKWPAKETALVPGFVRALCKRRVESKFQDETWGIGIGSTYKSYAVTMESSVFTENIWNPGFRYIPNVLWKLNSTSPL
jgi:hypothetical protein